MVRVESRGFRMGRSGTGPGGAWGVLGHGPGGTWGVKEGLTVFRDQQACPLPSEKGTPQKGFKTFT